MNCSTGKTREFPKEFACPITLQILEDCVIAEDGHTYEREAITRWFNAGQTRSPVTNEVLSNRALFPNLVLRRLISQYRTQLGEQLLVVCCDNTKEDEEEDLIDLLDRGADVNMRHRETGKTPLLLLIEAKKFTLAQRLIEVYGADASITDNALQTCAQCAERVDSTNVVFIQVVNKATSLAVAKHAMEIHLKAKERHLFRQRQEERGNPTTTTTPAPIALTREPSIGFFPSLFSLQFQSLMPLDVAPHAGGGGQGLFRRISTWSRINLAQDRETAERGEIEHHQHILSKSLLFMGSLVLLSLLLF